VALTTWSATSSVNGDRPACDGAQIEYLGECVSIVACPTNTEYNVGNPLDVDLCAPCVSWKDQERCSGEMCLSLLAALGHVSHSAEGPSCICALLEQPCPTMAIVQLL